MQVTEERETVNQTAPVRGSLRLQVMASNPQVNAGTQFSIFVVIQNPFEVPITIYQVQTHIPVELLDVNAFRLERARKEKEIEQYSSLTRRIYESIRAYRKEGVNFSGVAVAVGTDFNPEAQREFARISQTVETMGENSSVIGLQLAFPQNPSSEDLDRIFRRLSDYKKGLIPVTLQPGDSVVRQFVLCTRSWLFFTPLTHTFQIQVDYSSDGVDHADTIAYQQNIRSTISAIAIGAVIGAIIGTILKALTDEASPGLELSLLRVLPASILASIIVVIAFARKSSAQPIVSVEDFWGGGLIGFSTGFFGFEQFFGLFSASQP